MAIVANAGSKSTTPLPVYAVEDSAFAWRMLRHQLEFLGREYRHFDTCTAFIEAQSTLPPGIIVLDIHLPGMSGLELLEQLSPEAGPFAVIAFSGSSEVNDAIGAFRRGAIDFLRKPSPMDEMERSLKKAGKVVEAELEERRRQDKAASVRLSRREKEVLQALAQGRQSKVIAHDLGISIRTVEMHRSNIIAKLDARNASHALTIAQDLGLIG